MGHRSVGRDTGRLRAEIAACGAVACGVAKAEPVADSVMESYLRWLDSGGCAGMDYMRNHIDLRHDPRLLLEGAKSIVSMAFSYESETQRDPSLPHISTYALLPDYHVWVKKAIRESGVGDWLGEEGKDWRICVDSAPVMERYWAVQAGIGFLGDNGALIVPGVGSKVILAEILTNIDFEADIPAEGECLHCGKCRCEAATKSGLDCNSCISYLTIEHRGEWENPQHITTMQRGRGRKTLFGCDRCIESCPMNQPPYRDPKAEIKAIVAPLEGILNLTPESILDMEPEKLSETLRGSALKRAKREGLLRNARNILSIPDEE